MSFPTAKKYASTSIGGGGKNVLTGMLPKGVVEGEESEEAFKKHLASFKGWTRKRLSGEQYYDLIKKAIKKHSPNMPIALMYSLIRVESGFDPKIVSPVGAKGLAQFMDGTSGYNPRTGKVSGKNTRYAHNPYVPEQNIDASVRFIVDLLNRFDGDISRALYGYNAGPNRKSLNGTTKWDDIGIRKAKSYANTILDYTERMQYGEMPDLPLADKEKNKGSTGIALIGDSNAWRINQNYVKSNPNSVDMHQGAWAARHWLKTLNRFEQAKASGKSWRQYSNNKSGTWDYDYRVGQLLKQNPSRIDVTMLGGNDAHEGTIGTGNPEDSKLIRHINNTVKPLMQIIKKYGGTYAGAAAAPKRLQLRVKLNIALEKAAKEVGIPFYNPTKNIAYDMKNWGGSRDRVHLLGKQAEAEFLARKQFYLDTKGFSSGGGGLPPELQNADIWKLALGARAGKDIALSPADAKKTTSSKTPSKSNDLPDKVSIVSKSAANADQLIKLFNSKGGSEVRHYFVRWLEKGAQPHYNPGNKYKKITSSVASQTWGDIIKYADTGNVNSMKKAGVTLSLIERFLYIYNDGSSFRTWLKNLKKRLSEVKGNTIMKITQERLAQIIKEEVEAYRASQLNEGLDADELDKQEAYIKEITDLLRSTYDEFFKAAAPAVGTPQTKADTGEPVTDQTAHEDAKGLLLDLLGDAIDKFQEKDSMHEDGHEDVPSAVRAMKTMAEDALEMLDALEQMDGTLPTWWTNKMAVSASMLNKMRDYLLVPSEDEVLDEQ